MLIECSECKGAVSDKATSCPHCGAPVEKPKQLQVDSHCSFRDLNGVNANGEVVNIFEFLADSNNKQLVSGRQLTAVDMLDIVVNNRGRDGVLYKAGNFNWFQKRLYEIKHLKDDVEIRDKCIVYVVFYGAGLVFISILVVLLGIMR